MVVVTDFLSGKIEELELSLTEATHRAEEAEHLVSEMKLKLRMASDEEQPPEKDLVCCKQFQSS